MRVAHVSDVHIRSGGLARCRFEEYAGAIRELVSSVRERAPDAIVVTGDVFHDKTSIGYLGIELFYRLVYGLSSVARLFIIRGNHDFSQEHAHEYQGDLIESLLKDRVGTDIVYLKETGVYDFGEVRFGVLDVQDVLREGAGAGNRRVLPAFPAPGTGEGEGEGEGEAGVGYRVALYHGQVRGATNCHAGRGYPDASWFSGYDFAMLGDVHQRQVHRDAGLVWGYAGSLVQQNHGESVAQHGYLLWDLATGGVEPVDVPNDYGFVSVKENEFQDLMAVNVYPPPTPPTPLGSMAMPMKPAIRVMGQGGSDFSRIKAELAERGVAPAALTCCIEARPVGGGGASGQPDLDIDALFTQERYRSYVRLSGSFEGPKAPEWESWLAMDKLEVPEVDGISAKCGDRNTKLRKLVAAARSAEDTGTSNRGQRLRLLCMRWGWIACYGPLNRFDFRNASGKIAMLSAPNGSGKSAFLETVVLALFGQCIPSRSVKDETGLIVNINKPPTATARTELTFSVGDREYQITREFPLKKGDGSRLGTCDAFLTASGDGSAIRTGKSAVDKWVSENVGDITAFLLGCLVSQDRDCDFFSLKHTDQKQLIDDALNARALGALLDAIAESRKAHKWLADTLETMAQSCEADDKIDDEMFDEVCGKLFKVRRKIAADKALARLVPLPRAIAPSAAVAPAPPHPSAKARRGAAAEVARLRSEEEEAASRVSSSRAREPPRPVFTAREEEDFFGNAPVGSVEHVEKKLAHYEGMRKIAAELRGIGAELETARRDYDLVRDARVNDECWACRESPVFRQREVLASRVAGLEERAREAEAGIVDLDGPEIERKIRHYGGRRSKLAEHAKMLPKYAESRERREGWRAWEAGHRALASRLEALGDELGAAKLDAHAFEYEEYMRSGAGDAVGRNARFKGVRAALEARLDQRRRAERACAMRLSELKTSRRIENRQRAKARDYLALAGAARDKQLALALLERTMEDYQECTYKDTVSRMIEASANAVLSAIQGGAAAEDHLSLFVEWRQKQLVFKARTATSACVPIQKASGYQKMALSLAMRIALSRIGAGSVTCSQLCIDEAFVGFDSENVGHVPEFLKGLLASYESVIVVSHLLPWDVGDNVRIDKEGGNSRLVF